MSNPNEFILIIMLFFLALVWWDTILAYPLRLLVTLLHEVGHPLGAIVSGGKGGKLLIRRDLSGNATTAGGSPILVLNMGYLGSMLLGFMIFLLPYSRAAEHSMIVVGAAILLISLAWVKNTFGLAVLVSIGVALAAGGWLLGSGIEAFVTKFIGVCCMLYSYLEVERCRADAAALQEITKIPAIAWKISWQLVSLGVLFLMARIALGW